MGHEKENDTFELVKSDSTQLAFLLSKKEEEKHIYHIIIDGSGSTSDKGKNSLNNKFKSSLIAQLTNRQFLDKKHNDSLSKLPIRSLIAVTTASTVNSDKTQFLQLSRNDAGQGDNIFRLSELIKAEHATEQYIDNVLKKKDAKETNFDSILDNILQRLLTEIIRTDSLESIKNNIHHVILISDFEQDSGNKNNDTLTIAKLENISKQFLTKVKPKVKDLFFFSVSLNDKADKIIFNEWTNYVKFENKEQVMVNTVRNKMLNGEGYDFPYEFAQQSVVFYEDKPIIFPFKTMKLKEDVFPLKSVVKFLKQVNKNDSINYGIRLKASPVEKIDHTLQVEIIKNTSNRVLIGTNETEEYGKINLNDSLIIYHTIPNDVYSLWLEFVPDKAEYKKVVFPIEFQRIPGKTQHIYTFFLLIILILAAIPPLIIRRVYTWVHTDLRIETINLRRPLVVLTALTIISGYVIVYYLFNLDFTFFDPSRFNTSKYIADENKIFLLACLLLPLYSLLYFTFNPPPRTQFIGTELETKIKFATVADIKAIEDKIDDLQSIERKLNEHSTRISELKAMIARLRSTFKYRK